MLKPPSQTSGTNRSSNKTSETSSRNSRISNSRNKNKNGLIIDLLKEEYDSSDDENKDLPDLSDEYILPDKFKRLVSDFNHNAAIKRHNNIVEKNEKKNLVSENDFSSFTILNCGVLNKPGFTEKNLFLLPNENSFTYVDRNTIIISNGWKQKVIPISDNVIKRVIFKGIICNLYYENGARIPDISTINPGNLETIQLRLQEHISKYIANKKKASFIVDKEKKSSKLNNNLNHFVFKSENLNSSFSSNLISKVIDEVDEECKRNDNIFDNIKM